jgi:hypothetical protein
LALVGAAAPALAADAAPGADAVAEPTALPPLAWPDLADLTLAAPVVLRARIDKVRRLSGRDAADVPPGEIRAVVNASLLHVLRAPGALGPKAAWQWQGKARGRRPAAFDAGHDILAFVRPSGTAGNVQQYQLLSPVAMQPWSADLEEEVRAILLADTDPAQHGLMVTGGADGSHGTGPIDGASESQFFLTTRSGRRLVLTISRTPDADPAVTVATGEMVDRGTAVRPRTLLSHGLACGLPAALPEQLAADPELMRDYALARARIGPCERTPR